MATEITIAAPARDHGLTIDELKHRQQQIHKLLAEVLKEGIDDDYARIPGTKKLSLLKPGAEKICNLFQFVPTIRIEEYRDGADVTFRAFVVLSTPNGTLLGEGIGQASTKETKFAWRKAVCEGEYDATEPSMRRLKWSVDDRSGEESTILQVRENPADKENNMLKIAKKRGLIDAVLTITGASNLFTQDREDDIPANGSPAGNGNGTAVRKPPPSADNGPIIEKNQAGRFYYIWSKDRNPPRTPEEVKLYLQRKCGVSDSRQMPEKFYKEACRWAASNEPVPAESAPTQEQPQQQQAQPEKSAAQKESESAFEILGYDDNKRIRFRDQYQSDWVKILGELKILVAKRDDF